MPLWLSESDVRAALPMGELIDANFDLRASIYPIDQGNLEMIHTARKAGASANFAGSGGAVVGTYAGDAMFTRIADSMRAIGVAVVRPKIVV